MKLSIEEHLLQNGNTEDHMLQKLPRLECRPEPLARQRTYGEIFDYISSPPVPFRAVAVILANADVVFDETVASIPKLASYRMLHRNAQAD